MSIFYRSLYSITRHRDSKHTTLEVNKFMATKDELNAIYM